MRHHLLSSVIAAVCALAVVSPAARGQTPVAGNATTAAREEHDPRAAEGVLRRADLIAIIPVAVAIRPVDKIQILAPHNGRFEQIKIKANGWADPKAPIGFEVSKELASLLDSNHTTREDVFQDRWKSMFPPTPLECPTGCFVMSTPVKPKTWVQAGKPLIQVASALEVEATFSSDISKWRRLQFILEVWPASDPKHRKALTITSVSDGSVIGRVPFGSDIIPGSSWKGRLKILLRRKAYAVPTPALIHYHGSAYLPVRVSPGISNGRETEIVSGVRAGQHFLNLRPDRSGSSAGQNGPGVVSEEPIPAQPQEESPQP